MKKIIIIIGLILLGTQALWATVTVDGHAYLENQTQNDSIEVFFERIAPSALTYTVFTNASGYYTANIETGIYDITYSKDGYNPGFLYDQSIFVNTTLPNIILTEHITLLNVPSDFATIQSAIDYAYTADTVIVQPGTYYENINFSGKNITVASLFFITQDTSYISQTIIDGDYDDNVVKFENGEDSTAVLTGFTITNGCSYHSGGIHCDNNSSPSLKNITITGNFAYNRGGGIGCYSNSSPILKNVAITGNTASADGGGICCYSYSSPSLINVTITGNTASADGGGIYCLYYSSPILENVTITDNFASGSGGGIYCWNYSSPILENVTITDNSASGGGGGIYCRNYSSPILENVTITGNSKSGIYCYNYSSPSLENVTITNNYTNYTGGGIYCWNYSLPSLENVTITNNSAWQGGGIYCGVGSSTSLVNCIVSENTGNYGIYVYSGSTSITFSDFYNNENGNFYNCCPGVGVNVTTNANGDSCDVYYNIQMNPCFVDTANCDYHLTENSPCIDAGDPDSPLDPDSTIADMGAHYFDQLPYFPNADFSADITTGISPLIVDLTDLSTMGLMGYPIIEWFWDFDNDGMIDSYEQNPQWTYTEAGLYTVTLTVGDGSNTGTETKVDYITVWEPIDADFEANPTEGLLPLDVQFTDLSTGGLPELVLESKNLNNLKIVENDNSRDIVSWEWDFNNDGTIDSYEQNPQWTYTEAGLYTVILTVSDGSYTDTEIKIDYINVGEPIIADFEAVPLLGLAPLDVQFTDLSTGGLDALLDYVMSKNRQTKERSEEMMDKYNSREITTWEWDFNYDGTIDSYEQNPQWTYTEAGLYTVKLTVSDGSNTGTETKMDYITVGETIVADFEADPTLGSFPLYVQFTDLSTGGLEILVKETNKLNNTKVIKNDNSRDIVYWEWDFDNNGVIDSYEQNPTHIYDYVGYYSVSLTVTDNNNNSDILTKEDYIFVNPDIEFSYQTDGVIESGISLLSEDVLYCAASGDCVYRFNNSGQIEYTLNVNGDIKSATTITPDHNVYIASTDYNLYSFNSNGVSNTGWPLSLGAEATASVASDSVGNIYIGTQNGIFQAVDSDGVNIWSYNVGAPVHSSAVISSDNTLYVVNTNGKLYAFDLNTINPGNVVYKWIIETNGSVSSTPALDDNNNIYIANENGQLIKINDDGINGNVVWTFESGSAIIESSPIIDNNYNLYFGCNDGKVYSVNDSGQLNWMSDEFDPIKSTGALFESDEIQSRIYIGSDNGKLYALSTEDGTALWQFTADSAIICPILSENGKIYFGTINGKILAINDPDISTGTILRDTSIWSTFQGNNLRTGNQTDNMVAVDPENVNNISYLMQNYPNPISSNNKNLKISFFVKNPGNIKIQLFNTKGQMISTLINEEKNIGEYTITYPINSLSSGIYFTRMSVDGVYKEVKKMILLR